jgi:hypothetical protein
VYRHWRFQDSLLETLDPSVSGDEARRSGSGPFLLTSMAF